MTSNELIRFDYAIKRLLRNKANFAVLEGFIEVILERKCKIQAIIESETNKDNEDQKYNRVDIKAQDEYGEIFIVEVIRIRQSGRSRRRTRGGRSQRSCGCHARNRPQTQVNGTAHRPNRRRHQPFSRRNRKNLIQNQITVLPHDAFRLII